MLFILENSHKNDGSDLWKEFPFITQMIFEKKQIYSEEKNSNVMSRKTWLMTQGLTPKKFLWIQTE